MQVTLIHNPRAGKGGNATTPDAVIAAIRAAGHTLTVVSDKDEGWARALDAPGDLVAVHGGDGTVGSVARRLIGRGVPLAVLAGGTANNIAMTLGTEELDVAAQARGWAGARRIAFDAGVAHGPFGARNLLEGLGLGLFAWAMRTAEAEKATPREPQARVAHALAMLTERVAAHPPTRVQATLDGNDVSGDYVVLEAMNTQFIGPNLFLAPDAHPGDGLLDLVTVDSDARNDFREQLASWKRGAIRPPPWPSRRGRHLVLHWGGYPLHLDDEAWPGERQRDPHEPLRIELTMRQAAIEFLVPPDHPHPPLP
jgi:diacylglycerol kinase family enzyme